MGGVFEFREGPELLPSDGSVHVVGDEVVDLVVGHSADDNIVVVGLPVTAGDDEVEPLFGHIGKLEDIQAIKETNRIGVHARGVEPARPAFGLLAQYRAVKARAKILGVAANANLGPLDLATAAMKDCHQGHATPFHCLATIIAGFPFPAGFILVACSKGVVD